jgi:hypothetical protein
MKKTATSLLLASSFLIAGTAQAQTTFSVGPQVGGTYATVHFAPGSGPTDPVRRLGVEAGLMASLQRGHFAFQPAVLYTQRGYNRHVVSSDSGFPSFDSYVRLDYVNVPLRLAYTQHATGRGFQVSAGPYVGLLVGGKTTTMYQSGYASGQQINGRVVAAETHTVDISPASLSTPDTNYYARHLDLGAQVGVGYRVGGALVQLSYSLGLRNVSPTEYYTVGGSRYDNDTPTYHNRSFQASLSYLFGLKS